MSVSDGQKVNAAVTNAAYQSKTTDNTITADDTHEGLVSLERVGSGAIISDAQQQINDNKLIRFYSTYVNDAAWVSDNGTAIDGAAYYNTTDDKLRFYKNGVWTYLRDEGESVPVADISGTLPVTNGGTGETTAQAAINSLSAVSAATDEHVLTKDTATGDAIWKAAAGASADLTITEYTSADTVDAGDGIIEINPAGAFTLTLPTLASAEDRPYYFKFTGSASHVITIDGNGAETVAGETDIKTASPGDYLTLYPATSDWKILADGIKVYARYTSNNGQSITDATTTIVNFEDVDEDNLDLVTTGVGTWAFTAPRDGDYHINAAIALQTNAGWAAGDFMFLAAYVGGSLKSYLKQKEVEGGTDGSFSANLYGSGDLYSLNQGDSVDIRVNQDNTSNNSISLATGTQENYISIKRVRA